MAKRKKNSDKKTIYDVADAAGVSLATVSRVINNSSVVKESTRIKVQEVIDQLDFKPNEIARGLAKSKTTTIAVVFPESLFAHLKEMIGGIGDTCRTLKYNVIFYTTDDIGLGKEEDVISNVVRQRVDGVILFNSANIENQVQTLVKYNMPIVVVGADHTPFLPEYTDEDAANKRKDPALISGSVLGDVEEAIHDLCKKYLDQGKNRIVYVQSKQNLIKDELAVEGAKRAYDEAGVDFENFKEIHSSNVYGDSLEVLNAELDANKYDVIVCNYDKDAFAAIKAAQQHGLNVPEDLEVYGMFNTSYADMSTPKITSINIPVYDMGAIAVRYLTKVLGNEEIDNRVTKLNCYIVERESTK